MPFGRTRQAQGCLLADPEDRLAPALLKAGMREVAGTRVRRELTAAAHRTDRGGGGRRGIDDRGLRHEGLAAADAGAGMRPTADRRGVDPGGVAWENGNELPEMTGNFLPP